MVNIENIFKNKLYFNYINSDVTEIYSSIIKTSLYKTMLIKNPQSIGIYNSNDL